MAKGDRKRKKREKKEDEQQMKRKKTEEDVERGPEAAVAEVRVASAEVGVASVESTVDDAAAPPQGYKAFATMSTLRGLDEGEISKKWRLLSDFDQAACADWENFVHSTKTDFAQSIAKRFDVRQETVGTSGSDNKDEQSHGDELVADQATVESEHGALAESAKEEVFNDESKQDETAVHDGSHEDSSTDHREILSIRAEHLDETDSVDEFAVFVTGLHVFARRSQEIFASDVDMLKEFAQMPLRDRLKCWNRAKKENAEELTRRKDFTHEKGKRLRMISAVVRFELADRAQLLWDESVQSMTAELQYASADSKAAILSKYKLKNLMNGLLSDVSHLAIMERLSKTSTGLRHHIQEACFGNRKAPQNPWGLSFLDGEYPTFDALRDTERTGIWPRLCSSPLPIAVAKIPVTGGRRSSAQTSAAAVSSDVVEQSAEQGGNEAESASVVVPAKKSSGQKKGKSSVANTKDNTFRAPGSAIRRQKEKAERINAHGSLYSNFGSFATLSKLITDFYKRLAAFNLTAFSQFDGVNSVLVDEVAAPTVDAASCYDMRDVQSSESLTSGARLFYEKFEGAFHLRVLQVASASTSNNQESLLSALANLANLLDWHSDPRSLRCEEEKALCAELANFRNLRLGCWRSSTTGLCVHASTGNGGNLVGQLTEFLAGEHFATEDVDAFVDNLQKLDKRLTRIVDECFPSLAAKMRQPSACCRLRQGKSVFTAVTLLGARGQHGKNPTSDIGVRAFVHCPLDKKGKRKLLLPAFEAVREDAKHPLAINMKHGSVVFIPAKTSFALTYDKAFDVNEDVKCVTLEFFCGKNLLCEDHGTKYLPMKQCVVVMSDDTKVMAAAKTDVKAATSSTPMVHVSTTRKNTAGDSFKQ